MGKSDTGTRVVLIGGSSNVGKSTLGQSLAATLGWDYRSTDKLARHPGFPWVGPDGVARPVDVIEHYRTLSVEELLVDVLAHYQKNVLPQVEGLVHDYRSRPGTVGLVLEGSALWPEFVVGLVRAQRVRTLWLTANDQLFRERIYGRSRFEYASEDEKYLVQKFLSRTLLYNERMKEEVERLGLVLINVGTGRTLDDLLKDGWPILGFGGRSNQRFPDEDVSEGQTQHHEGE